MKHQGAVAAGHQVSANAAADILRAGGNAFDGLVAAMWAACVAEPVLASLGGGGFVMARPGGVPPRVYDFFVETPLVKRPGEELEFDSRLASFAGGVTQEFHGGYGSVATPGMVAGLFALQRDLCRMPMADLAAPAIAAARNGVVINDFQRYVMGIVTPLLAYGAESRAIFGKNADGRAHNPDGDDFILHDIGDTHRQTDLADSIDYLVRSGADGFYRGDIAQILDRQSRDHGGYLTVDDLRAYRVLQRDPITVAGRAGRFVLNPPPASGGVLAGFGLKLARMMDLARPGGSGGADYRNGATPGAGSRSGSGFVPSFVPGSGSNSGPNSSGFGSARHLAGLTQILHSTGVVRGEYGASPSILSDDFCETYRSLIGDRPLGQNGTTHISVVDGDGNLAAATISNGSCSGRVLPATGIMLNNMLGEADLSPAGFHNWPCGVRMTSMMTPALYLADDGRAVALGSGGSNRIRSTMMQVMFNLDGFGMELADAIAAPRLHVEGDHLSIEPGFDADILDGLPLADQTRWQQRDMFFGGVHAAMVGGPSLSAVGDDRRDGFAVIVN